jgi:hypothetical protein
MSSTILVEAIFRESSVKTFDGADERRSNLGDLIQNSIHER